MDDWMKDRVMRLVKFPDFTRAGYRNNSPD